MTLPYNSTLDDVPSDQKWNKGWRCMGEQDKHVKLSATTQETCFDECLKAFKLAKSEAVFEVNALPEDVSPTDAKDAGCCYWHAGDMPDYRVWFETNKKDEMEKGGCYMAKKTRIYYTGQHAALVDGLYTDFVE